MKRSILTLLPLLSIGFLTASGVHASSLFETRFSSAEGYETGALASQNQWTAPEGNSASVISTGSTTSPVGSDHLLELTGNSSSAVTVRNELIFTDTPLTSSVAIDIWMMRSAANSSRDSYFNATSSTPITSLGNGAFIGFDDDRFLYQRVGSTNSLTDEVYQANIWYRFHMEIDPALHRYSLTIYDEAGSTVVETLSNLAFRGGTAVAAIDVLRFTQPGGSGTSNLYVGGVTVIPEPSALALAATMAGLLGFCKGLRRRR